MAPDGRCRSVVDQRLALLCAVRVRCVDVDVDGQNAESVADARDDVAARRREAAATRDEPAARRDQPGAERDTRAAARWPASVERATPPASTHSLSHTPTSDRLRVEDRRR
jgi:hypothetical protein